MVTLAEAVDADAMFIPVSGDVSLAVFNRKYRIDDEIVILRAFYRDWDAQGRPVNDHLWQVSRGVDDSVAAAHDAGADVDAAVAASVSSTTLVPPAPFASGGGGGGTLEQVLAEGNETGENTIVMPMGTIDGRESSNALIIEGLNDGSNVQILGGADGGSAFLKGGDGTGSAVVQGGASGGSVYLTGGTGDDVDGPGGDITMTPGAGVGAGRNGLIFPNLPTDDPLVIGALWNDDGIVTVSTGPSYADVVIADAPIAYWQLGEPSGNPQDSVGSNDVTVVAGSPTYGVAGATAQGTAITLTRADGDYFQVPDSDSLNVGDVLSVEMLVKRGALGNYHVLFDHGGSTGGGPAVYFNPGGTVGLAPSASGTMAVSVSSAITDTDWHHLVFTKDGTTRAAYLDGVAATTLGTNTVLTNGSDALSIGSDTNSNDFDGTLQHIALYDYALTAGQVAAHFAAM